MLNPQAIERAAVVLEGGEFAILPTDTVPGLFILDSGKNERRLRELKGRVGAKPFARMFGSRKQILERVRITSKMQELALQRLLPGKLTLIFPSARSHENTLGVRLPLDSSLRALIRRTGPLIATSANLAGEEVPSSEELASRLLRAVALVEESSSAPHFFSSTVVDLTGQRPVILRKGAVSVWTLGRRLGKTPYLKAPIELYVLFVCGGNTCRSPLAAAIFADRCRSKRILVQSAGLSASTGAPATEHARTLVGEMGLSLEKHRATLLTGELFRWADLLLAMTRDHLLRLRREYPEFADRAFLLSGFPSPWPHGRDITDPLGLSLELYRSIADEIRLYVESICGEINRVLTDAD